MAILGAQLVFSLVVFSFLQKLSKYYSCGRWLLSGKLLRYLHPTDEQLKEAAGLSIGANPGKVKNRKYDNRKNNNSTEGFSIPRNTHIQLDSVKVETIDLVQLHFFEDLQWLIDFCISAMVVYFLTELYFVIGSRNEMNISILWCLLAIGFCLRILFAQTANYFKAEEGGEKILIICFGFFFLVASMGVLVIDDKILEFGLEEGYNNFSVNAEMFLQHQGIESKGPVSFLTFKIILTFVCSITGGLLTFPGLRYAKLHLDTLKYSKGNTFKQTLLHINFIFPIVILLLWFKPIGRDVICAKHWRVTYKLMDEPVFEIWRIFLTAVMVILRLILITSHLQSYLNLAYERVQVLKKETGRINSIDLQKMVARVFYYLCVVALQYITPLLLLVFLMFLQKTLGEYSWSSLLGESLETKISSYSHQIVLQASTTASNKTSPANDTIADAAAQFTWALASLRQVFSPMWYRGLFAFLNWWTCACWFTSASFGVYYYSKVN